VFTVYIADMSSASGGQSPPDRLTRGFVPGPHWGLRPRPKALRRPRRTADFFYAPPPPTSGHRRAAAADFLSERRRFWFSGKIF